MHIDRHIPLFSSKEYFTSIVPKLFEVFPGLRKWQQKFSIRFDIEQPIKKNIDSWTIDRKGVRPLPLHGDITLKTDENSFLKVLNGEGIDPKSIENHLQKTPIKNEANNYFKLLLNPHYLHTARMGTLASCCSKEAAFILSNPGIGLFATLHFCLHILSLCEKYSIKPYFVAPHLYSSKSNAGNWLELLLSHKRFNTAELLAIKKDINAGRFRYITHWNNYSAQNYQSLITFEKAHALFFQNFEIRQSIYLKAQNWAKKYFNSPVLGIHYRGTDKSIEAPRVLYSQVTEAIHQTLNIRNIHTIFVATDEIQLRDAIIREFSDGHNVVSYSELCDTQGLPIHKSTGGTSETKMEEAFIDSFLLSMCNIVIKTSSYLSAWSKIFNPKLEIFGLNKPIHSWPQWQPDLDIPSFESFFLENN